jgi:hypothetical protein
VTYILLCKQIVSIYFIRDIEREEEFGKRKIRSKRCSLRGSEPKSRACRALHQKKKKSPEENLQGTFVEEERPDRFWKPVRFV